MLVHPNGAWRMRRTARRVCRPCQQWLRCSSTSGSPAHAMRTPAAAVCCCCCCVRVVRGVCSVKLSRTSAPCVPFVFAYLFSWAARVTSYEVDASIMSRSSSRVYCAAGASWSARQHSSRWGGMLLGGRSMSVIQVIQSVACTTGRGLIITRGLRATRGCVVLCLIGVAAAVVSWWLTCDSPVTRAPPRG